MKVLGAFLILFWLSLPALRAAESPEPVLPPVFVTATRTETPLSQVTTSASVITEEDIEAQQSTSVFDVLRTVPGLDVVQSGSRGNATSVFVRGAESDHVLVLIDGVEVNSTTLGAFNFAHLTTENIERIEVVRGAGGTLYGSQAIGGVINIITKRGSGPLELGLSAAGGNASTHRQVATLRGQAAKLRYSLSAARIESDGFRSVNDDYRNLSTSARLDFQATESAHLTGIFHFFKNDLGLYNSNNFASQPDPNAREASTQYIGKLEWEQKIVQSWDYRLSGSFFKEHIKNTDDVDSCVFFGFPCDSRTRDRFRPQVSTAEFQTNYRVAEWSTTTFGLEYKRRAAETSSGIDKAIRNVGYYLQEQLQLFDRKLILIPGIRLDDNQSFGTAWTPAFSTAYIFRTSGTKVKAGYAKGFKAPTLNELFFPPGFGCPAFGNPNLKPERSWEVNAGVEQKLIHERLHLAVTYFHREAKDLIEGRPIPGDPLGCFRAENVGRARFDGVEWIVGLKLLSLLDVNAQYTYLEWDTADGKLRRRPRHRGGINFNFSRGGLNVNLNANLVGRRDDFRAASPGGDVIQPGYGVVDLASSYLVPWHVAGLKDVTLFGKIANLFDKRYEEADGFRARPLNFLLGIRATFGG